MLSSRLGKNDVDTQELCQISINSRSLFLSMQYGSHPTNRSLGAAAAAIGFDVRWVWLSHASLFLPFAVAGAHLVRPDSPESLAVRLYEDLGSVHAIHSLPMITWEIDGSEFDVFLCVDHVLDLSWLLIPCKELMPQCQALQDSKEVTVTLDLERAFWGMT